MRLITLSASVALIAISSPAQILQSIVTPDKAVGVIHQTLGGTWLSELRPPTLPPSAPPILLVVTFNENGTAVASSSDGAQSASHGIWVRVGDRKFLSTIFVFAYNEARVLTTITKARINLQVSLDGQTMKGTNEVVVMDRTGKVMATIPGGTVSSVRLSPEIPADFYDFQKVQ